jgi:hypothetical protein
MEQESKGVLSPTAERKAFLFRVNGAWAGLALVFIGEPRDVAEFFVMQKYRRHGIGARFSTPSKNMSMTGDRAVNYEPVKLLFVR